jgi:hypothetical protein
VEFVPTTCTTFALGITLDEDGDVVVVVVAGLMGEEDAIATIPIAPDSAIHIAHQMTVLGCEAKAIQMRMEGLTLEEKRAEVEKILAANEAETN